MRDLLLFIRVDGHLIKELPGGFHVAVWIVRGEDDAVDTDRVHHAQIGLSLIHIYRGQAALAMALVNPPDWRVDVGVG